MKHYIGIDPGLGGAVGIVYNDGTNQEAKVFDTPTSIKMVKGKKKSSNTREFDISAMVSLLKPYVGKADSVYLERVHAMPGQGSVSTFGFGEGLGIWKGIIVSLGFNLEMVSPQTWKKEYGDILKQDHIDKPDILDITTQQYNRLPVKDRLAHDAASSEYEKEKRLSKEKSKNAAMDLVVKLFPNIKDDISLKKHDGRAEAVLIAEYGRRLYTNTDH
jgi:crossover junction endodeoxyribonuclease RuvC